jgi:hypothetical protein
MNQLCDYIYKRGLENPLDQVEQMNLRYIVSILATLASAAIAADFVVISPTMSWDHAHKACESNGWHLAYINRHHIHHLSKAIRQAGHETGWMGSKVPMVLRVGKGFELPKHPREKHAAVCEISRSKKLYSSSPNPLVKSQSSELCPNKPPQKLIEKEFTDSWTTTHVSKEIKTLQAKNIRHHKYKKSQLHSRSSSSTSLTESETVYDIVKIVKPHKVHIQSLALTLNAYCFVGA